MLFRSQCSFKKLVQFLLHPLLASQFSRSIFFVLVVIGKLTNSALEALNAQLDWPAGEDALKTESVQVLVRLEENTQVKFSNAWQRHHRYGLIVLKLTKLEIACSIHHQANRPKVWQFG